MKNVIIVLLLLICCLGLFLATVDLTPFLTPDPHLALKNEEAVFAGKSAPAEPVFDEKPQAAKLATVGPESPVEEPPPAVSSDTTEIDGGIERDAPEKSEPSSTVNPDSPTEELSKQQEPDITVEELREEVVEDTAKGQAPSPLLELEVTILPEADYPFSVHLATFGDQPTAAKAVPYYQKRGISAHWVKVNLGDKGTHYRLFTGVFQTAAEAQQFIDRNTLVDKPIKRTYYSARIGIYHDKAELADAFIKTRETGVFPYILGSENGNYYLYVGAFYTFIGATDQCRELTDAGLSCEPVKRSTVPL